MTPHSKLSSEKIEGTVFSQRQVRTLKIVVIVLGILLVACFALVIGTIVYQSLSLDRKSDSGKQTQNQNILKEQSSGATNTVLPTGINILSTAFDQNLLAITYSDKQGLVVIVLNTKTGDVVSTTRLSLPAFSGSQK